MDLCEELELRAVSYEQSGPSAHHTAVLLRKAKGEIEKLRADLAAERADHEAAIKGFDEHMRDIAGHGW